MNINFYVIIVAGGSGLRMGPGVAKQFRILNGRPVLLRTVEQFEKLAVRPKIVIVLPRESFDTWKDLCHKYMRDDIVCTLASGGITRFHSVKNALDRLPNDGNGIVAVHDGVRPLVSVDFLERCLSLACNCEALVPVTPVTSSVRRIEGLLENPVESQAVERDKLYAVQTPQLFKLPLLKKAYGQPYEIGFTDDATVAQKAGVRLSFTKGEELNIKLTTPEDLTLAGWLIGNGNCS